MSAVKGYCAALNNSLPELVQIFPRIELLVCFSGALTNLAFHTGLGHQVKCDTHPLEPNSTPLGALETYWQHIVFLFFP